MAKLRTGITYRKGDASPYVAMVRYRPGRDAGAVARKRFEKYEDACAWQSAEQAKVTMGTAINPNDRGMTVEYVALDWLKERETDPRVSRGTYENNRAHWRALAPTFADMAVVDVSEDTVKRWQVSQLAAGRKESTCAVRQTTLTQILDHARRLGIRVPNASRDAGTTERKQVAELPEFDVNAAIEIIGAFDERFRIGALLAFGAGLRSGEFRGLRLTDCTRLPDGSGELHICHAINRWEGNDVTLPKGRKARRVKVSARLLDRIEDHCATFGTGPRGEVMSNRGDAVTDRVWREAWSAAVRRSGVDMPKGQAVHMLRHIYAQRAIEANVDIADVAGNLGHAQNATTWRYYTRTNARTAAASDVALDALDAADARKTRAARHLRAV